MTTLVIGSGGFLGQHLMHRLPEAIGLDDGSRATDSNYEIVDVNNYFQVFKAFEVFRPKVVYHLAAINGTHNFYSRPYEVAVTGGVGTHNVIRAARFFDVKKFIYFSSSEAHQSELVPTPEEVPLVVPDITNPRYSYGGGKIFGELLTVHSGLDYTIIRPYNVYGPGAIRGHIIPDLLWKLKHLDEVQLVGDGTAHRSFCYVDDFIDGVILAQELDDSIINVGNDEMISIGEAVEEMQLALGVNRKITYTENPKGEVAVRCPDISKLRAVGFRPRSFKEGIRKYVDAVN